MPGPRLWRRLFRPTSDTFTMTLFRLYASTLLQPDPIDGRTKKMWTPQVRVDDAVNEPLVRAFCSYVHKDNESFGLAIEHLVEDIRSFHEAETGRSLRIF